MPVPSLHPRGLAACAAAALAAAAPVAVAHDAPGHEHDAIASPRATGVAAPFDLLRTTVRVTRTSLVFRSRVAGRAGAATPTPRSRLNGAPVWSYVWPTSLNSWDVGFARDRGLVALAVTSHPDFDDTPRADENGDGDAANDGGRWHVHWVVLVKSRRCAGGLMVRPIPKGATPRLPDTWPGLPLLLDSPAYRPRLSGRTVEVRVPRADVGAPRAVSFDGVTAGLRVSTSPHDPMLCVADVFDVASGDLSMPGRARARR